MEDQNEPYVYVPLRATGKNKRARKLMLKKFPALLSGSRYAIGVNRFFHTKETRTVRWIGTFTTNAESF